MFERLMNNPILIDDGSRENWEAYQPEVILIPQRDFTQIRFTKKNADAVNIYKRKSENDAWEFIATAVNSPFDDHDADANWQYKIRCVKENTEIGIPAVLSVSKKDSFSK